MDTENEKQKWDRNAGDYQAVFRLGLNEYNASLLRFWQESGMLFPGARVIDIGCGVGKYGTYLAALGYDVTLVDISGKMLEHARRNMAPYRTPWAVYECDFNEVTGRESVFAGGFDLAISTMSPAIHDAATLRKMSAMTRGCCFLARFYSWEQPSRDALMRAMGMEPRRLHAGTEEDCAAMLRLAEEAGFAPQLRLADYNWTDERRPEEMADYLLRRYFAEQERAEYYDAALRAARSLAGEDGLVVDRVNTKVAWISWETGPKDPDTKSASENERAAQLRRIARYETLLRELRECISDPDASAEALRAAAQAADALETYYTSEDWKRDFADDEAGLLPRELPRGVLSEDGIYNALEAWRERREERDCAED